MYFEEKEIYNTKNNFHIDLNDLITMQKSGNDAYYNEKKRFFSPKEGFLRGNMFVLEYKPYKNLTFFEIQPKNEKEAMLLKIYELDFAVNDLNLHLDLNPDDKEAFHLFKIYVQEYENAKHRYENIYGPICLTGTLGEVYDWQNNPWPWDQEKGDMYV